MEKHRQLPLTPQQQLFNLRQVESCLSKKLRDFSIENPDQSAYVELLLNLDEVRWQIGNLITQIPSAGSSLHTVNNLNHDPQGRKPYRGKS